MTYFLGIDTSTTATKALLTDRHGSVVAIYRSLYPELRGEFSRLSTLDA